MGPVKNNRSENGNGTHHKLGWREPIPKDELLELVGKSSRNSQIDINIKFIFNSCHHIINSLLSQKKNIVLWILLITLAAPEVRWKEH